MSAWVSLPQQWLMTTWNKQTSTILVQKPVANLFSFEGQNTRTLERFVCKVLWFVLHRTLFRQNWYYFAQLYTSSISRYFLLLYIELSNSFLIGRKRTVNFRNQHHWHHNCRLHNYHVKDTQCQVIMSCTTAVHDGRVIMSSSSRTLCFFLSMKKQKHDFHFFVQCVIKQLLDSVFVISRILKVSVRVISLSPRLRLITLASTMIILDITKTSSNNSL